MMKKQTVATVVYLSQQEKDPNNLYCTDPYPPLFLTDNEPAMCTPLSSHTSTREAFSKFGRYEEFQITLLRTGTR